MNNFKQLNQINTSIVGIMFAVIYMMFIIFGTTPSVQAMYSVKEASATDNNINVWTIYIRGNDGAVIKRPFSWNGSVTINHKAGITSGSTTMCVGEDVNFGYDPSFTFTAGNGAWDTPYGKWVSSINQNRTGETETSTYWKRFYDIDGGGRWGRIAWSAVKPLTWDGTGYGSGKVYMESSDNNIVSCVGMQCVAIGDGNATITAHFPAVTTRMWTWARFSNPAPNGSSEWLSEHWENQGSVNDKKPNWMFCPTVRTPSDDNVNYCANRLILPAKTVSWDVNVGVAARCDYCGDGAVNGTPAEMCDTSWSGNQWPVNNCSASYNGLCRYCISPGNSGECTLITKRGPYCGDGAVNGSEQCDNGLLGNPRNGLPCVANYGETCNYCSNLCTNVTATGPYCGDGTQNGTEEECDGESYCDGNCEIKSSCNSTFTNSNERPTESTVGMCDDYSSVVPGSIIMNSAYQWEWKCQYNGLAPVTCVANNCLTDSSEFQIQSPVYFGSKSNVSVYCNGVSEFCCRVGGAHEIVVCSGNSSQTLPIDETNRQFPVDCWYDDDNDGEEDDGEDDRQYDWAVQTMCTARECNSQGTCQAIPVLAALPSDSQCSSTCNSNADCSSGRIIETRP